MKSRTKKEGRAECKCTYFQKPPFVTTTMRTASSTTTRETCCVYHRNQTEWWMWRWDVHSLAASLRSTITDKACFSCDWGRYFVNWAINKQTIGLNRVQSWRFLLAGAANIHGFVWNPSVGCAQRFVTVVFRMQDCNIMGVKIPRKILRWKKCTFCICCWGVLLRRRRPIQYIDWESGYGWGKHVCRRATRRSHCSWKTKSSNQLRNAPPKNKKLCEFNFAFEPGI